MITRAQMEQIFEHLLINIFRSEDTSDLYLVLKANNFHCQHPMTFSSYTDQDISEFSYIKSSESLPTYLKVTDRVTLKVFRDFLKYKSSIGETIGDTSEEWFAIKEDEYYDQYKN